MTMTKLTINNKPVEVTEGTSVLNAARSAGIEVPTLCEHSHLTPYGGCRLCLVEIEGARTLQPSCTLPVTEGMVVRTNTDKVLAARKFVLTLIFSERNHFCPFCQVSGGDCELQNAAYREGMTHWPLQPNWQPFPVDASHPYIVMENNRCILCRRCVRACGELIGNYTLGFEERGARSLLVADLGVPLGVSSCISCGSCVQVCPTGALIDRWSAYRGKETQVDKTESICAGCSVGCGIDVLVRDNNLVRIEGTWDAKLNEGVICKVGRFEPLAEERNRLLTPLVRKDGILKAATWEEALLAIQAKLVPLAGSPDKGIAGIVSSGLSIESIYSFKQLFADNFKSNMVTTFEEGAYTAQGSLLAQELGNPFEGNAEDLQKADCIVIFGVDLVKEHEVLGFFVKRSIPNGTKVIIIDPSSNSLENFAEMTLKSGKTVDANLVHGITAAVIDSGAGKNLTKTPAESSVKDAIEKSGASEVEIEKVGALISGSERLVLVYGKGLSADALKELVHLSDVTGAKIIGTKGGANSLAASQFGLNSPVKLNGHEVVFAALGSEDPSQHIIQLLEKAPFLVVQAAFSSALSARADVVLPSQSWLEQEGTYVNFEGKIQKAFKTLTGPAGTKSDEEIFANLASKFNTKLDTDWKKSLKERVAPVVLQG
jgi:formate dehydrogenase major subunit